MEIYPSKGNWSNASRNSKEKTMDNSIVFFASPRRPYSSYRFSWFLGLYFPAFLKSIRVQPLASPSVAGSAFLYCCTWNEWPRAISFLLRRKRPFQNRFGRRSQNSVHVAGHWLIGKITFYAVNALHIYRVRKYSAVQSGSDIRLALWSSKGRRRRPLAAGKLPLTWVGRREITQISRRPLQSGPRARAAVSLPARYKRAAVKIHVARSKARSSWGCSKYFDKKTGWPGIRRPCFKENTKFEISKKIFFFSLIYFVGREA